MLFCACLMFQSEHLEHVAGLGPSIRVGVRLGARSRGGPRRS
jgi:hypothetical protein